MEPDVTVLAALRLVSDEFDSGDGGELGSCCADISSLAGAFEDLRSDPADPVLLDEFARAYESAAEGHDFTGPVRALAAAVDVARLSLEPAEVDASAFIAEISDEMAAAGPDLVGFSGGRALDRWLRIAPPGDLLPGARSRTSYVAERFGSVVMLGLTRAAVAAGDLTPSDAALLPLAIICEEPWP